MPAPAIAPEPPTQPMEPPASAATDLEDQIEAKQMELEKARKQAQLKERLAQLDAEIARMQAS